MNSRKKALRGLVLSAFVCIGIYSCTHVSGTYISQHGSREGSSMKDNCMDCHKNGATEGGFIVGGTVFKEDKTTRNPNGNVYLFATPPNTTDGKDSIIATIEVDGVGNFYTTHPIDLSNGVYPAVQSPAGDTIVRMQALTSNGACNSCHDGRTQDKIHVR